MSGFLSYVDPPKASELIEQREVDPNLQPLLEQNAKLPDRAPTLPVPEQLTPGEERVTNKLQDGTVVAKIRCVEVQGCGTYKYYALRHADGYTEAELEFQSQDPKYGLNGWTNEALMAVLIDRLVGYQNGPTPNQFNDVAIQGLLQAQQAMANRVADREARGVRNQFTS